MDCGKCTLVCPHAAIRMKAFSPDYLDEAPSRFRSKEAGAGLPAGSELTIQVSPDDCTGCALCSGVCPGAALTMVPAMLIGDTERTKFEYFSTIPETDRTKLRTNTVQGSQLLRPLFEFSGACSGCGETPYLKLLSQLVGDRMVVANATGCSSIYGGNLPTTPWTTNADGCGPAWNNSLFEDNAEFGMGIAIGHQQRASQARQLLTELADGLDLPADVLHGLLDDTIGVTDESAVAAQRVRVKQLRESLARLDAGDSAAKIQLLNELADALVPTSVWVIGGDGWAYDIGFGGVDHLLASGENVNILVLDSEVYSNTGGQASKATPLGAAAKFAASGKATRKKDLGLFARGYRDVYVAQIAMNANEQQAVRALNESGCPSRPEPTPGAAPRLKLDSKAPSIPLREFYAEETRFRRIALADPDRASTLIGKAQQVVDERWEQYLGLAGD